MSDSKARGLPLVMLGSIGICALVSLTFVVIVGSLLSNPEEPTPLPEPRGFAAVLDDWNAVDHWEQRGDLAREITRDDHLLGMTKDEVEAALGPGWARHMSPAYGDIKYGVAPSGLDNLWLCIHLDDAGRVHDVMIRSD